MDSDGLDASSAAAMALAEWADFPADATPRPIVFLDQPVRIGEGGFVDGESKRAYLAGAIEASVPLPSGVLDLLVGGRTSEEDASPLQVTGVDALDAPFMTDRGPRDLSAYRVEMTGLRQPCMVLDPRISLLWPPHRNWDLAAQRGRAEIEPDGMTLHVIAAGGVLTDFVQADFIERSAAVVAIPIRRERALPPGTTAVPLVLIAKMITGTLASPLGNRVLIDTRGIPYAVVPAGTPRD